MNKALPAIAAATALISFGAETPDTAAAQGFWDDWQPRTIQVGNERDGWNDRVEGKARFNNIPFTESICYGAFADRNPDTNEIVLCVTMGNDRLSKLLETSDGGETWTAPHNFGEFTIGGCWGLSIPGNGVMILNNSYDRTADNWKTATGAAVYPDPRFDAIAVGWDRPYVFPDSNGKHLMDFGHYAHNFLTPEHECMALCRESFDAGETWTEWRGIPEFPNACEIFVTNNAQGELVAAIRTLTLMCPIDDQSCRLEISISKDGGKTWCPPKVAAGHGRHHPSLALLPDGRMVMSYVVRLGYPDEDGKYAYGVEAIVSPDGGHTWDTDHRYVLGRWTHSGVLRNEATGKPYRMDRSGASPQATNTFYLPESNELLTIYGTYQDIAYLRGGAALPSRVCAVKWKLLDKYTPADESSRPKAASAAEALAALRGNDYWSVNYQAITGLPDCGWINRYPERALSIREGKWLRMDHRGIDVGQFGLRGIDHLERINGPYAFRMMLNFLAGTADADHPQRLWLHCCLGEDFNKQTLVMQFFEKGRMTSEQFGDVTLPITDGTPFLLEGYIDPNARNAKLWVDGKLVVERDYARQNEAPETSCRLDFGYGSRSIDGVVELEFLQLGQITRWAGKVNP